MNGSYHPIKDSGIIAVFGSDFITGSVNCSPDPASAFYFT